MPYCGRPDAPRELGDGRSAQIGFSTACPNGIRLYKLVQHPRPGTSAAQRVSSACAVGGTLSRLGPLTTTAIIVVPSRCCPDLRSRMSSSAHDRRAARAARAATAHGPDARAACRVLAVVALRWRRARGTLRLDAELDSRPVRSFGVRVSSTRFLSVFASQRVLSNGRVARHPLQRTVRAQR